MGSSSVCGNEDPGMNVSVATMASSAPVQGPRLAEDLGTSLI